MARQEAKLQQEFGPRLAQLQQSIQQELDLTQEKLRQVGRLKAQVEDQRLLLLDRKLDAERANEELRTQLRLLEAKASPDAVWVEAFGRGFEKAWDAMWPLLAEGVQKSRAVLEQSAIESTLDRLDGVVAERAAQLGVLQPQTLQGLLAKQQEFQHKREQATIPEDRAKYEHYLTALDWMLHANGVHSNQPATQ